MIFLLQCKQIEKDALESGVGLKIGHFGMICSLHPGARRPEVAFEIRCSQDLVQPFEVC